MFECAIAYESVCFTSKDFEVFEVLRKIVGNAASFSSGGPGKGMYSRAFVNMLDKISHVYLADSISQPFE